MSRATHAARLRDRAGRAAPDPAAWRRVDDRGSSAVEFAILFPIIVVLLLGGTQTAMWYFGREVAQAAAEAGARAASLHDAPPGAGTGAADAYLDRLGHGTLTGHASNETETDTVVSVHVHATVIVVIPLPGFAPTIDVTATRPREVFTTPGGGP